ncbi:MAG TPA: PepSY-associated TM helix domain-containing protein [Gammaproteobacteria bacterium]
MRVIQVRHWAAVHAWAGLAASLVLAVIGASGALLVFKDDWIRLTVPGARDTVALDDPALARVAEAAEEAFGADRIEAVKFATPDLGVHRIYLADGGGAYLDGTGAVVDRWPKNGRLEDWLLDLHFKLLAGPAGEAAAGWLGLVGTALALSGVVIWWPARRSYRRRFVPRSGDRRELLGTHRDTGVWAAVPLVILCMSGSMMIFDAPTVAVLERLFGATAEPPLPAPASTADADAGEPRVDWRDLFDEGRRLFPEGVARIASWPAPGGFAVVRYRQPAEWHPNGRSTLTYDPAARRVVQHADATRFGLGLRINHALYPIHSARIGGPLYAAFVAVAGMMLAWLGLLGACSFLRRSRRAALPRAAGPVTDRQRP